MSHPPPSQPADGGNEASFCGDYVTNDTQFHLKLVALATNILHCTVVLAPIWTNLVQNQNAIIFFKIVP